MEIQGTVRDILAGKPGKLWVTSPDVTVYEAIRLMGEKGIGALVVVEAGRVVGVLSERDYSRKVVLKGRTSRDTLVSEIVGEAVMVGLGDSVETCMQLMTARRIRHLPVVDGYGAPEGMISMGDLVNWIMRSQSQTIHQLQGYIAGEYPG